MPMTWLNFCTINSVLSVYCRKYDVLSVSAWVESEPVAVRWLREVFQCYHSIGQWIQSWISADIYPEFASTKFIVQIQGDIVGTMAVVMRDVMSIMFVYLKIS